jgi:hypothetical protein
MSDLKTAPASMVTFSGTPTEIGGQIWERLCLPAVLAVDNKVPPVALAQLYSGFTMAAWGAMAAHFGHEQALQFAKEMLDAFSKAAPTLTGHVVVH